MDTPDRSPEDVGPEGLGPDHERWLAETLRLVAAGHEPSLRALYDATVSKVFGVARCILVDGALAEDAVADAYAQVWRDAGQYDPARSTVRNWIAMIVRARSIDLRRRRAARTEREDALDAAAAIEAVEHGPAGHAHVRERERLVRGALTALPPEQRVAVEAAFFGGLTHAEVARALGAPLGTVKSRIRAGLAYLRQSLGNLEAELS